MEEGRRSAKAACQIEGGTWLSCHLAGREGAAATAPAPRLQTAAVRTESARRAFSLMLQIRSREARGVAAAIAGREWVGRPYHPPRPEGGGPPPPCPGSPAL